MKKRLKTLAKIVAVVAALVLVAGWLAFWPLMSALMERRSAAAELRVTHVGGSVYLVDAELRGRQIGSSLAASLGPDGVLLVDTPMTAALTSKLRQALDGLGAGEVRWVVNTHPHPDHVRGNADFAPTATIVAHEATRSRMASSARPFRWLPPVPPYPREALPSETFDGVHSLDVNGEEVRLLHLGAGHTDGDVVVYFTGSNVVHVGDLFHGRGGHSVSDRHNAGGDVEGLARSLRELISLLPPDVRILCGHGGVGQVSELRDLVAYHEMLVEVLGEVKERIASGSSVDDVVEQGVPPRWRTWFEASRGDSVMHGAADGWLGNLFEGLATPLAAREGDQR